MDSVTITERSGQWAVETIEDGKVTFSGHYSNRTEAENWLRSEEDRLKRKKPSPSCSGHGPV